MPTRRQFIAASGSALATIAIGRRATWFRAVEPTDYGRFAARPVSKPTNLLPVGEHTLAEVNGRKTVVVVPASVQVGQAAPLILAFHGATEDWTEMLETHRDAAASIGAILITPSSEGRSWDGIRGMYGTDLDHVDHALTEVFQRCAVDPHRIAIAGFSDGGSYAVSLGVANGDLFTHIMAHSAGFIIPGKPHGRPRVFIAHGTRDRILPIDQCGRRISAQLKQDGYDVEFVEFDGGHMIQPANVERAMKWFRG